MNTRSPRQLTLTLPFPDKKRQFGNFSLPFSTPLCNHPLRDMLWK